MSALGDPVGLVRFGSKSLLAIQYHHYLQTLSPRSMSPRNSPQSKDTTLLQRPASRPKPKGPSQSGDPLPPILLLLALLAIPTVYFLGSTEPGIAGLRATLFSILPKEIRDKLPKLIAYGVGGDQSVNPHLEL